MSYTDYQKRWRFEDGEAYYIPQSKSYAEKLKGGLSISYLTHNYLLEADPSVKQLEQPQSTPFQQGSFPSLLPSEEDDLYKIPTTRRKGKKDPKIRSDRNRKKPHQQETRRQYQYELNDYGWVEINPSEWNVIAFYVWYTWNVPYSWCFPRVPNYIECIFDIECTFDMVIDYFNNS